MRTKAALLVELNKPLELADLEVPALKPGQGVSSSWAVARPVDRTGRVLENHFIAQRTSDLREVQSCLAGRLESKAVQY